MSGARFRPDVFAPRVTLAKGPSCAFPTRLRSPSPSTARAWFDLCQPVLGERNFSRIRSGGALSDASPRTLREAG
eukprot:285296-Pyramimonas_sp.AAC.1